MIDFVNQQLIGRITAAANNPVLPQDALSERLANVGLLPMFGFPTRVRYLFHQRPVAGYDWPPEEGVVDRDLDVAISQFAPGAETVKDGLIHTSVGVVNYRPQGNTVSRAAESARTAAAHWVLPKLPGGGRAANAARGMSGLRCDAAAAARIRSDSTVTASRLQNAGLAVTAISTASLSGRRAHRGQKWVQLSSHLRRGRISEFGPVPETIFVVNDNGGSGFRFREAQSGRNLGDARST